MSIINRIVAIINFVQVQVHDLDHEGHQVHCPVLVHNVGHSQVFDVVERISDGKQDIIL